MSDEKSKSNLKRVGDLDVDQNLALQEKEWTFERIAWGVIGLTIVLALAGLTGNGFLSSKIARGPDSRIWVEYSRFQRLQAPDLFTVHLADDSSRRLLFSPDLLEKIDIVSIQPRPSEEIIGKSGTIYVFESEQSINDGLIRFRYKPTAPGFDRMTISTDVGSSVSFWQFTFP